MTYKELQTALKSLRKDGYDIQVKLNSSREILQAEHQRLTVIAVEPTQEQPQEIATGAAMEPPKGEPIGTFVYSAELPSETLEEAPSVGLAIQSVSQQVAKDTLWIDGTELVMHLDQTQAQALRNLEDGFRWLGQLGSNIQAFTEGFQQGWKETKAKRSHRPRGVAKVIPLDTRKRSLRAA